MSPLIATTFWMYVCFADLLSGNARRHVEGFPKFATASTARYEWIAVEAVKTESTVTRPLSTTITTKAVPTTEITEISSTVPPGTKEKSDIGKEVFTTEKEMAGALSSTTKVAGTTEIPSPSTIFTSDTLTTGTPSASTAITNDILTTKEASTTAVTSGPLTTAPISTTMSTTKPRITTSATTATTLVNNDASSPTPPSFMTTLATTIGSLFTSTGTLSTNLPTTNDTATTEIASSNVSETNEATTTTAAYASTLFANDTTGTEMPPENISMTNNMVPTGVPITNSPLTNDTAITEVPLTNTTANVEMSTGTPPVTLPITNETETTRAPTASTPTENNATEVFSTTASTDTMGNSTEDIDKMVSEMSTVNDTGITRPSDDPKLSGLNMSMYTHLKDLEKRINTGEKPSIESLVKVLVLTYRIQQLGGEVSTENRDLLKKIAPLYEKLFNEIITS